MKTIHEDVAKNLSKLMAYKELNQMELSKKTGVSQRTISNILNPGSVGGITTSSLEKIAEYFKIEPYHLMIPDMPVEELLSPKIEKVISLYIQSTTDGRDNIVRVSEMAAKYNP